MPPACRRRPLEHAIDVRHLRTHLCARATAAWRSGARLFRNCVALPCKRGRPSVLRPLQAQPQAGAAGRGAPRTRITRVASAGGQRHREDAWRTRRCAGPGGADCPKRRGSAGGGGSAGSSGHRSAGRKAERTASGSGGRRRRSCSEARTECVRLVSSARRAPGAG